MSNIRKRGATKKDSKRQLTDEEEKYQKDNQTLALQVNFMGYKLTS